MGKYIGTMWIEGEVDSYDFANNRDVFGYYGETTIDHIWPIAKNGSNFQDNLQYLTAQGNNEKADDISGYVNGVRFTTLQYTTDDFGKIEGTTYITEDEINWYEVINNDN